MIFRVASRIKFLQFFRFAKNLPPSERPQDLRRRQREGARYTGIDGCEAHSSRESRRLSECLEEIDDNILACRQYLQDYERIRSSLFALNEKLTQLGAESVPLPDGLTTSDLGEIVRQRIEHLRTQSKI